MNCKECGANIPQRLLTREDFACPECGKRYRRKLSSYPSRGVIPPVKKNKNRFSAFTVAGYCRKNWLLLSIILVLIIVILSILLNRNPKTAQNNPSDVVENQLDEEKYMEESVPAAMTSGMNLAFDSYAVFDNNSDEGAIIYNEDRSSEKYVSWEDYVAYVNLIFSSNFDNVRAWDDFGQLEIDITVLESASALEAMYALPDSDLYTQYGLSYMEKAWAILKLITTETYVEDVYINLNFVDVDGPDWTWSSSFQQTGENGNINVEVMGKNTDIRWFILESTSLKTLGGEVLAENPWESDDWAIAEDNVDNTNDNDAASHQSETQVKMVYNTPKELEVCKYEKDRYDRERIEFGRVVKSPLTKITAKTVGTAKAVSGNTIYYVAIRGDCENQSDRYSSLYKVFEWNNGWTTIGGFTQSYDYDYEHNWRKAADELEELIYGKQE